MAGSHALVGKLVIFSRTGIGNPCNVRASGQASAETGAGSTALFSAG